MMRVYDSIRNCINSIQSNSNGTDDLDIKVPESFDTPIPLDSFIENSSSSLELLFVPSSSSLLLDILSVCEKLYPTTKISIRDYFQLKYTLNFDQREKKAMKIMNGLNEANWEIVLNSLEIYSDAFMTLSDPDPQFSQLIINRFLLVNLFHVVNQLYKSHRLPLDVNTYCRCLLSKFWDLFNNSANLNEKIGKLHSAVQIIPLFDNITSDESLSSEKKTEIIQIKHLLKAISNMKNFKIVVERGVPVTPNQIFKKFTTLSSDTNSPTDLISLILEQNPKSYLAYEKLYRILNDLILATPIMEDTKTPTTDRSSNQIARLKSVCIESALIDNNFQFAYSKSIELFEHCSNEEILSKTWLTIFQVGKYISPSWYEEESTGISDKIEILLKQREILSMLLKIGKGSSSDNSKLIINQISKLNGEINEWYQDETNSTIQPTHKRENVAFGSIANEIVHDATNTTHQASEKLSNLFVSGLGWAIGANP